MATTVEAKILAALLGHLEALALTPALPIAYPLAPFTPPSDAEGRPAPFLRANMLPAPTAPFSVAQDGANEHTGILQVDVMWRQGAGLAQPTETAGAVVTHFRRGLRIRGDGITVEVSRTSVAPAVKDDPRISLPVSITYRAFLPN